MSRENEPTDSTDPGAGDRKQLLAERRRALKRIAVASAVLVYLTPRISVVHAAMMQHHPSAPGGGKRRTRRQRTPGAPSDQQIRSKTKKRGPLDTREQLDDNRYDSPSLDTE